MKLAKCPRNRASYFPRGVQQPRFHRLVQITELLERIARFSPLQTKVALSAAFPASLPLATLWASTVAIPRVRPGLAVLPDPRGPRRLLRDLESWSSLTRVTQLDLGGTPLTRGSDVVHLAGLFPALRSLVVTLPKPHLIAFDLREIFGRRCLPRDAVAVYASKHGIAMCGLPSGTLHATDEPDQPALSPFWPSLVDLHVDLAPRATCTPADERLPGLRGNTNRGLERQVYRQLDWLYFVQTVAELNACTALTTDRTRRTKPATSLVLTAVLLAAALLVAMVRADPGPDPSPVAEASPSPNPHAFPDPIAAADPAVIPANIHDEAVHALHVDGGDQIDDVVIEEVPEIAPLDLSSLHDVPSPHGVDEEETAIIAELGGDGDSGAVPLVVDPRDCPAASSSATPPAIEDLVAIWNHPRYPPNSLPTPTASLAPPALKAKVERVLAEFDKVQNPGLLDPASCGDLGDGRGFTAGIGAFTTFDGNALAVLTRYRAATGRGDLAMYEPALAQLADLQSSETAAIPKFCCAWTAVATDPATSAAFAAAQQAVVDDEVYVPAMLLADTLGASSALFRAHLYDAVGAHGLGDDPDSVYTIASRAQAAIADWATADEAAKHAVFADARAVSLYAPYALNPDRDSADNGGNPVVTGAAAARVECFRAWAKQGNWALTGKLECKADGGLDFAVSD
ncbi:hypothetical protein H9P43_007440 [Blastocladiella emersonii ATCC 22665]|nr:hypothetical protein H9P43_007440 [Blastocladiella emersonii ATCC 22665]